MSREQRTDCPRRRKGQAGQETTGLIIWGRDAAREAGGPRALCRWRPSAVVSGHVGRGEGGREGGRDNAVVKGKRKESQRNRLPESAVGRVCNEGV